MARPGPANPPSRQNSFTKNNGPRVKPAGDGSQPREGAARLSSGAVPGYSSLLQRLTRTKVMAKLRHIALIVPDPEKAAKFFEEAFDMKVAGKARRGLYVSDGTVN